MSQMFLPRDVESKFRFITVAAQRAKQLQSGAKPRVDTASRKPTTQPSVRASRSATSCPDSPRPITWLRKIDASSGVKRRSVTSS